tara:strand:- start:12 stop:2138 length:2127 start_codon:yes stop_codon:yes gene_type:complete
MKKLIFAFAVFLTFLPVYSQGGNPGDSCAASIPIGPGTHYVENINGEDYELNCSEYDASNGDLEWYIYTPNDDYLTTITSDLEANDGLDTRFHVYQGSCGDLSCVAGDDDSGDGYLSVTSFYVYAGESYYIAWDDRWENESFEFQLIEDYPPPVGPFGFTVENVSTVGSERGLVDMNNDKLDDLVSIQQTSINIHYQLEGGGFNPVSIGTSWADNTPSWSLAAGDFDGNGYNDLLYGGGSGVTFMQANSDGTSYTEISSGEYVFSQRSNFVDINNDGHLDAFVCHDVEPTVYYINDGEGNLQFFQGPNEEGVPSGIGGVELSLAPIGVDQEGGNYGSVWIDYDNDRDIDMFIAKCRGGDVQWKNNELWRNNGDGTFSNVADVTGWYNSYYPDGGHDNSSNLGDPIQTWSSAWGDFNNDGYLDVYVGASNTYDGEHKLMKNNGDGTFTDYTVSSGVLFQEPPYGIENNAADVDNDGYIDIFTDGDILLNNGDFTFTLYTAGVPGPGAIGDANNDGFVDMFNGTNLYLNDGNNNNWIKVTTTGTTSNINGIGARVEISSPGVGTQIRDVVSGSGFRYMSSLNTHFGIGSDSSVSSITVYWPSGTVDVINNPGINTTINITEGETLSLENSFIGEFVLYPNPVKNTLTISSALDLDQSIISVFDIAGRRVLNYKLADNINSIDVSRLSAGEYILRIITKEKLISSEKFIKQ